MKLYNLLEIKSNATEYQIKKAYHKLAKKWHPDKNLTDTTIKFQQINYAYNILINPETRRKYHLFNKKDDDNFMLYLIKIASGKLSPEDLKQLNISIDNLLQKTLQKFNTNYKNIGLLFKNLDLMQIFKIFIKEEIDIINNYKEIPNYSDSDIEQYNENDGRYYFDLPIKYLEYNQNNINININIELSNIFSNEKKKLKIIRNINNIQIKQKFIFDIKTPYIIFTGCGDIDDNKIGDLIIKLNLPNFAEWFKDMILFNYNISLYQYIYGLDLNINLNSNNLIYKNWIPNRDGNMIILDDNIKFNNIYKIGIKFNVEYKHNNKLHSILLENFSK